ncbi:MAG: 4Fe-4S dicluster domain-containing protein [Thermodesulfobacteriota bacterium]|nr:4Fe-4S dicluster domain-containing protein [Thermodesulfobacteriota bacterium]
MIKRRDFLKGATVGLAGLALPFAAAELINPQTIIARKTDRPKVRWAFLVDTVRCVGCGLCVRACKQENEVPYDANVTRTWVERYVLTKDKKLFADTPKAGRDGFTTPRIDLGMGNYQEIRNEDIAKAFFVPKLCNQCENPPCVQVCPVGATYQLPDGIMLVDREWCIGCGYCIMACPYGIRFFHPKYHTADKCNFCYHRITKGMNTACVDACPYQARQVGNFEDPADPVTRAVMTERVRVLKSEYGTKPHVFYRELAEEVR